MTLLQLEEVDADDDLLAQQVGVIVKCGWCGELFSPKARELAVAMCQSCHDRMLAELLRAQEKKRLATLDDH